MPHFLRADAQDNRDRIVAAARTLFSERGMDVPVREIARRADVAAATLYRRLPTKQALVDEAFAAEQRQCRQIVEDGANDPDAWRGFTSVVERLALAGVRNRRFVDSAMSGRPAAPQLLDHRRELLGMLSRLATRAQTAGVLREDFVLDDLIVVLLASRGLGVRVATTRDAAARRFARLAVDAFRAQPGRPVRS